MRVIRSAEAPTAKQGKLQLQFDVPAGTSQWIAARVTAFNGAVAHSSPVYVLVDGEGFADRTQVRQLVEKRLKVLDFIAGRLRGEGAAVTRSLDEARKLYEAKLHALRGQ